MRVFSYDVLYSLSEHCTTLPIISNCAAIFSRAFKYMRPNKVSQWPTDLVSTNNMIELSDKQLSRDKRINKFISVFESILAGVYEVYSAEHGKEAADIYYSILSELEWARPDDAPFVDLELESIEKSILASRSLPNQEKFELVILRKLCKAYME
ncbi:hypothetical protein AYI70_g10426 [Smittium culicis]|uniref:Uncharacterized protein n=1 Tax=Smittium culicis TaxID=133412 RepID=A0A1R1X6Q3_9FUNG|nr:hypothetical protein AYI70_g10426 [Smittium culicis]